MVFVRSHFEKVFMPPCCKKLCEKNMYIEKKGKTYEINIKTLEVKELKFKGVCAE